MQISDKTQNTSNQHGVMHQRHQVIDDFLNYIQSKSNPVVLDIGCAYGIATLPALSEHAAVVACDISQAHLQAIKDNAPSDANLRLLHAKFPDCDFEEASFDAILLSHVLPFLSGDEITTGFQKLYRWLKPSGHCFILSYSIYNKLMQDYIPIYEKRCQQQETWPGELSDASRYWQKENPLANLLPTKLNHLSPELLAREAKNANFKIVANDWFSCARTMPECILYDGKEAVRSIFSKRS